MEIAQTIDEGTLSVLHCREQSTCSKWRQIKDPDWWIQYLKDMGLDPRNR